MSSSQLSPKNFRQHGALTMEELIKLKHNLVCAIVKNKDELKHVEEMIANPIFRSKCLNYSFSGVIRPIEFEKETEAPHVHRNCMWDKSFIR
jgi:hypothetical protein